MSRIQVETELFKGDDPIDFPEDVDGDSFEQAILGAKLSLDRGDAERVVIYVSVDGELIDIMDRVPSNFDVLSIKQSIERIKEEYRG